MLWSTFVVFEQGYFATLLRCNYRYTKSSNSMRITRYYCNLLVITTLVIYRLIIINGYEHDGDSAKTAPCGRLRLPGDDLSIVSGQTSGQALKEPGCR